MSEPQPRLNLRWFIPMMIISMGSYLMMKGPAKSDAQLIFRVGTIVVGIVLMIVLNLPKRES